VILWISSHGFLDQNHNCRNMDAVKFKPGNLVRLREREWIVLPELRDNLLKIRPLSGSELDATLIYLPLESTPPVSATFDLPNPENSGDRESSMLLTDALRLKLRAGAGPFRSFGNLNFEPRTYQLVPLMMALRLSTLRLLIADDVGIGKTIEAGLIVRELFDRGEIEKFSVICPPHLCEQWQCELYEKFNFDVKVIRTGTVNRLERGLRQDESLFEVYPFTVVSLDYIKSEKRRYDFQRTCPNFVIVDEAHTCVHGNPKTRHQRYQLLKGLAQSEPVRSMVLLTATPHSGDDATFHNLLALLNPEFKCLIDLPSGEKRDQLRNDLSLHFVQRRRGDIKKWENQSQFPSRESRESTYRLTGEWGTLFTEVLQYARTMVIRSEGGTQLQQRMCWWAALALLRCISSSPAAAYMALRTRLKSTIGDSQNEQIEALDRDARDSIMDDIEDGLMLRESTPAGTVEEIEDSQILRKLIDRAQDLCGPKKDPKLSILTKEITSLVRESYRPVIFCRFIATAHYVAEHLRKSLSPRTTHVIVVTGEMDSAQRQIEVEELIDLPKNILPVLVATDCLSEGINLQNYFNAVIHYDLAWNPTRHEQREGRADRFGQTSKVVRTLMLYGENNPIDGAIIRVILQKAERIRKELGVHVPLPVENDKLIDTMMRAALFRSELSTALPSLDFGDAEDEVDLAWETVKQKISRTVFAQHSLKPEKVISEWEKTISVLGGPKDVERFVRSCANRLGAPLNDQGPYCRFPINHLPNQLQDRFGEIGFKEILNITFSQPPSLGAVYIHRTHPIISILADYVLEHALDNNPSDIGSRCNAMFTKDVAERTVLYLLRLRFQLHVERRGNDGKFSPSKSMLAEECLCIQHSGSNPPRLLTHQDAFELLSSEPSGNMNHGQKTHLIRHALNSIGEMESFFNHIADEHAKTLLKDHRRIRDASDERGLRYNVNSCLPTDKIGLYIFIPWLTCDHGEN